MIVALITITINVISLFYVAARWLFPQPTIPKTENKRCFSYLFRGDSHQCSVAGFNSGRFARGEHLDEHLLGMLPPAPNQLRPPLNLDAALGYALLRLTLGLNFLFHSYSRWHDGGKFVDGVVAGFAHTPLPAWGVRTFTTVIPYWEPAVGLLLVLGLWTRWALAAGALLIALLTLGTALRAEYPVLSEQLIYALVFFILLFLRIPHDRFGVDGWGAWRI